MVVDTADGKDVLGTITTVIAVEIIIVAWVTMDVIVMETVRRPDTIEVVTSAGIGGFI